jgi:carbon storage regulator
MLVLTRKIGEAIQIGEQVSIEVLEVRGGRVRLGITAPSDVGVQRSELLIANEAPVTVGRQSGSFAAVQRRPVAVSGS